MKVVMTRKELDRRIAEMREYGDDALVIAKDVDAPSGYSICVPVSDGDEFLPITVEG